MGDFLLDFRPCDRRPVAKAVAFLRFFADVRVTLIEESEFCLLLTSQDDPGLWGPAGSVDGRVFAALCGRVALDEKQWDEGRRLEHRGGLACKYVLNCYFKSGLKGVGDLSGHFTIFIFDRDKQRMSIITDRWGVSPAFKSECEGTLAFGSHPDALADCIGESRNWDLTSFAEFILTSKISYPFTYYKRIRSLPYATVVTVSLGEGQARIESTSCYYDMTPNPEPEGRLDDLAEELASAFRVAVQKRTLPILGRTAIALSGGLDSRTILCSTRFPHQVLAFCCHDEENLEFRTARAIAREAGSEFLPLRRNFDFYADHASLGTKISGGMGCLGSNHFLGFRDTLSDLGVANLLTGCYCDYLFKGLALNKVVNPWTRIESIGDFSLSYYGRHTVVDTPLCAAAYQRLEDQVPSRLRKCPTESSLVDIENLRIFPMSYEEDNAARTIPMRVMGWYLPVAENSLMEIRLKMSSTMKLNRRLFARTVRKVCGTKVSRIPDANTGASVDAPFIWQIISTHLRRGSGLLHSLRQTQSTGGSWLNWEYYIRHSSKVSSLWRARSSDAEEVFKQVLGRNAYHNDIRAYKGCQLGVFLQLLTLKLWFDHRPK